MNRRIQMYSKHKTEKNIKDPQKKYRLGTVSKLYCGGLKPVIHRLYFPNDIVFLSLKIKFVLANSSYPDAMLHSATLYLGLQCL